MTAHVVATPEADLATVFTFQRLMNTLYFQSVQLLHLPVPPNDN